MNQYARLQRVERAARQEAANRAEAEDAALDKDWQKALALAPAAEREELLTLKRYALGERTADRVPDRDRLVRYNVLEERIMGRVSPERASEIRCRRDLVLCVLRVERERLEEAVERDDAPYEVTEVLDALELAELRRCDYIVGGGEPVPEPGRAEQLLDQVFAVVQERADPSQIPQIEKLVKGGGNRGGAKRTKFSKRVEKSIMP